MYFKDGYVPLARDLHFGPGTYRVDAKLYFPVEGIVVAVYPTDHPNNELGKTLVDVQVTTLAKTFYRIPIGWAKFHKESGSNADSAGDDLTDNRQILEPRNISIYNGFYFTPEVGDVVLIQFVEGLLQRAFVSHFLGSNSQSMLSMDKKKDDFLYPREVQAVMRFGSGGPEPHYRSRLEATESESPRMTLQMNGTSMEITNTGDFHVQTAIQDFPPVNADRYDNYRLRVADKREVEKPTVNGDIVLSTTGATTGRIGLITGRLITGDSDSEVEFDVYNDFGTVKKFKNGVRKALDHRTLDGSILLYTDESEIGDITLTAQECVQSGSITGITSYSAIGNISFISDLADVGDILLSSRLCPSGNLTGKTTASQSGNIAFMAHATGNGDGIFSTLSSASGNILISSKSSGRGSIGIASEQAGTGDIGISSRSAGSGNIIMSSATAGSGNIGITSASAGSGGINISSASAGKGSISITSTASGMGSISISSAASGIGAYSVDTMASGIGSLKMRSMASGIGSHSHSARANGIGRYDVSTMANGVGTIRHESKSNGVGNIIAKAKGCGTGRIWIGANGSGDSRVYLEAIKSGKAYVSLDPRAGRRWFEAHGEDKAILDSGDVRLGHRDADRHAVTWEELTEVLQQMWEIFDTHTHSGVETGSGDTAIPNQQQLPPYLIVHEEFMSKVVWLDRDPSPDPIFQPDPEGDNTLIEDLFETAFDFGSAAIASGLVGGLKVDVGNLGTEELSETEQEQKEKLEEPISEIPFDAEFLFKPESESTGKLVILLPPGFTGKVADVTISGDFGSETGTSTGVANGGREHFRFSQSGRDYGGNVTVTVTGNDGSTTSTVVADGGQRTTGTNPPPSE